MFLAILFSIRLLGLKLNHDIHTEVIYVAQILMRIAVAFQVEQMEWMGEIHCRFNFFQ